MKIRAFSRLTVTLDLDPTDCIIIADALATAVYHDLAPDPGLVNALRAVFEACPIVAATDTLRDNGVSEAGMLDDTRRVWGPLDTRLAEKPRVTKRPA